MWRKKLSHYQSNSRSKFSNFFAAPTKYCPFPSPLCLSIIYKKKKNLVVWLDTVHDKNLSNKTKKSIKHVLKDFSGNTFKYKYFSNHFIHTLGPAWKDEKNVYFLASKIENFYALFNMNERQSTNNLNFPFKCQRRVMIRSVNY